SRRASSAALRVAAVPGPNDRDLELVAARRTNDQARIAREHARVCVRHDAREQRGLAVQVGVVFVALDQRLLDGILEVEGVHDVLRLEEEVPPATRSASERNASASEMKPGSGRNSRVPVTVQNL